MANSLQDQLLKAGAASKQQALKASTERRRKKKQKQKKGAGPELSESSRQARRLQAEQAARDRELNLQRQQEADSKAIAAQIQQLIEQHKLQLEEGDTEYNFVDETTVQKILVNQEIQSQLSRGVLAIAKQGDKYAVVPLPIAEKIMQRDAAIIIPINKADDKEIADETDDPYADYKVPDDLLW